jgi:hypothetical protein
MKASTRRWVTLSALGLLALDLGVFAIAVPRARGWLESARSSSLVRAGAIAVRDLERLGTRRVDEPGFALLPRFTGRSGYTYAFVLRPARLAEVRAEERARLAMTRVVRLRTIETRCVELAAPEIASSAAESTCPLSSCPQSTCPKRASDAGTTGGSPAIGLPTSALRLTIE